MCQVCIHVHLYSFPCTFLKAAENGTVNLFFVQAVNLNDGRLYGTADLLTVRFPWGTSERGVITSSAIRSFFDTVLPVEKIYASFFQSEGFGDVNIDAIRKEIRRKNSLNIS